MNQKGNQKHLTFEQRVEIEKGLACSSGKHKGETKISHRGRKLLRVIYAILRKGTNYDPKRMLMDIRRPAAPKAIAA